MYNLSPAIGLLNNIPLLLDKQVRCTVRFVELFGSMVVRVCFVAVLGSIVVLVACVASTVYSWVPRAGKIKKSSFSKEMRITYSYDGKKLLGTGGAINNSLDFIISDEFLVIYGDSYLDVNYKSVLSFLFKINPSTTD